MPTNRHVPEFTPTTMLSRLVHEGQTEHDPPPPPFLDTSSWSLPSRGRYEPYKSGKEGEALRKGFVGFYATTIGASDGLLGERPVELTEEERLLLRKVGDSSLYHTPGGAETEEKPPKRSQEGRANKRTVLKYVPTGKKRGVPRTVKEALSEITDFPRGRRHLRSGKIDYLAEACPHDGEIVEGAASSRSSCYSRAVQTRRPFAAAPPEEDTILGGFIKRQELMMKKVKNSVPLVDPEDAGYNQPHRIRRGECEYEAPPPSIPFKDAYMERELKKIRLAEIAAVRRLPVIE